MVEDSCIVGKDRRVKIVLFFNMIRIREWEKMGVKNVNLEICIVLNVKVFLGVVYGGEKGKCC